MPALSPTAAAAVCERLALPPTAATHRCWPLPPAALDPPQWLDELLPEDAAEMCQGRVRLVVTEVPSLRLRYLQDFESKQDLIDANSEHHKQMHALAC